MPNFLSRDKSKTLLQYCDAPELDELEQKHFDEYHAISDIYIFIYADLENYYYKNIVPSKDIFLLAECGLALLRRVNVEDIMKRLEKEIEYLSNNQTTLKTSLFHGIHFLQKPFLTSEQARENIIEFCKKSENLFNKIIKFTEVSQV